MQIRRNLNFWFVATAIGIFVVAIGTTLRAFADDPKTSQIPAPITKPAVQIGPEGTWLPPDGAKQLPIWPANIPGMEAPINSVERAVQARSLVAGRPWTDILDVSTPTMTIFPPKAANSGVAMVVFPGGGFKGLAIDLEGTEICDWLTQKGITCVLLKYRVPKSAHYWDESCRCHITPKVPRALQDAQRTIRLVRARALDLKIDPNKIGVIGMSAGGYLVAQTSNIFRPAYPPVDRIDRVSSRPSFAVALYPGHLCRDESKLDPDLSVTRSTPPTFLLQATDDPVDEVCNSIVYAKALTEAGVSTEVHLFAKGGHAFGLRHTENAISGWPALVETWLHQIGMLEPGNQ